MVSGLLFFEQGGLQVIGEITSLANVITTIKQVLPELEKQEKERVLNAIPDDELERLLEARRNRAEKAE